MVAVNAHTLVTADIARVVELFESVGLVDGGQLDVDTNLFKFGHGVIPAFLPVIGIKLAFIVVVDFSTISDFIPGTGDMGQLCAGDGEIPTNQYAGKEKSYGENCQYCAF